MNVQYNRSVESRSYISYIEPSDKSFQFESIPSSQTTFPILGNLYLSKGRRGKVIQIKVKKRIGDEASFAKMCQKVLADAFANETVGKSFFSFFFLSRIFLSLTSDNTELKFVTIFV